MSTGFWFSTLSSLSTSSSYLWRNCLRVRPTATMVHLDVEDFSEELLQCLLCHKEPAPRIQSPLLGAFCLLLAGSLWHKRHRSNSLEKSSTWRWTTLFLLMLGMTVLRHHMWIMLWRHRVLSSLRWGHRAQSLWDSHRVTPQLSRFVSVSAMVITVQFIVLFIISAVSASESETELKYERYLNRIR